LFTGIIEAVGVVKKLSPISDASEIDLLIESPLTGPFEIGESIAVDGVCLTLVSIDSKSNSSEITFYVSPETLNVTRLSTISVGSTVNLERAMWAGTRFSGHYVQGHVDQVGKVTLIERDGESKRYRFQIPGPWGKYCIKKGSIAINGISLTINQLGDIPGEAPHSIPNTWVEVQIIPHTLKSTNLKSLRVDDPVNIEVDLAGKYFERFQQFDKRP